MILTGILVSYAIVVAMIIICFLPEDTGGPYAGMTLWDIHRSRKNRKS